jgi:hypothetical protein
MAELFWWFGMSLCDADNAFALMNAVTAVNGHFGISEDQLPESARDSKLYEILCEQRQARLQRNTQGYSKNAQFEPRDLVRALNALFGEEYVVIGMKEKQQWPKLPSDKKVKNGPNGTYDGPKPKKSRTNNGLSKSTVDKTTAPPAAEEEREEQEEEALVREAALQANARGTQLRGMGRDGNTEAEADDEEDGQDSPQRNPLTNKTPPPIQKCSPAPRLRLRLALPTATTGAHEDPHANPTTPTTEPAVRPGTTQENTTTDDLSRNKEMSPLHPPSLQPDTLVGAEYTAPPADASKHDARRQALSCVGIPQPTYGTVEDILTGMRQDMEGPDAV